MLAKKKKARGENRPRILIVTPEITYLPDGMGNLAQRMVAKAGGMADVSASLVTALHKKNADVHVALPNYRRMFAGGEKNRFDDDLAEYRKSLPGQKIHLAQDRAFYHRHRVYSATENLTISLAFQREVINNILPRVQPDLIHCNDWMTGLVPATAKRYGVKTLFTIHNIHTEKTTLAHIEDRGIDAAAFWSDCFYRHSPGSYEAARNYNPVDFLATGIFASTHVNSVSPTFLSEVVDGWHSFVPGHICHELWGKCHAHCATGILNAPDASYDPVTDRNLHANYQFHTFKRGKDANKAEFQKRLGLRQDSLAPLFFWPSRLDPVQKGPQLLAEILYQITCDYPSLQIAFVASGPFQVHFHEIVRHHGLHDRVAVTDFDETLARLGYAAADFMLMPSRFEPCGLPQMISPKYGTLPVAHDTGGIHDTIDPLDLDCLSENHAQTGNGFLFRHYDRHVFLWAIGEAIRFHNLPESTKEFHISRVMRQARHRFNHSNTATEYIALYEKMLGRSVTG